MALLREQRNMVRAVYEYHGRVPLTNQNYLDRLVASQAGAVTREDIMKYCIFHKILLSDNKKNIPQEDLNPPSKWAISRRSKMQNLMDSCLKEGFLQPVIERVNIPNPGDMAEIGLMATSKGTDLFQFWGFMDAWAGKYRYILGIATGAFMLYIAKLILYAFGINI